MKQRHQRHHSIWSHLINFHYGHQTMLKSLLLFLISLCLVGRIYGFGYVDPETIYAFENEVNQTIECSFNLSQGDGLTSSDLLFNETCDNSESVIYRTNSPFVEVLNESAIKIRLPNRSYSKCKYVCQLKNSNVAFTSVFIGKRLDNVKNFKCRSKDWKNMTCDFTEMDNYIPLSYDLQFKLDHKDAPKKFPCPLKNDSKRGRFCDVYFDGGSSEKETKRPVSPYFYRAEEVFHFTLVSKYAERTGLVGENTEEFKIDHLAIVVPNAPVNLHPDIVGTNNATIRYEIPSYYKIPRIQFDYDVNVKSEYDHEWKKTNFTAINSAVTTLTIPLDYAFTDYDIQLRIKMHNASYEEDLWSPYVNTAVKTMSKVPDRPPTSIFGAFYIHDDDNLTIYWQQLKKFEENGPQFQYRIRSDVTPTEMRHISAEFSNLDLVEQPYTFYVSSANSMGASVKPLEIQIPKKSELLNVKISLIQTYNDDNYNLTWTSTGPDKNLIDKFVIFSCDSRSLNPNTCDEQLEYKEIKDNNTNSLLYRAEPKLIFAIAAYGKNRTTGMQWNECRANSPNYIGKLLHVAIDRTEPVRLSVKWTVDCPDKSIVEKFNVTYCEGDVELKCHSSLIDKDARRHLIQGLKPFTVYKILVSMISSSGKQGAPFEVHEKTTETAPSPPRNLTYSNLTSNSVSLQWIEPEHINGVIRHHRIYYYKYDMELCKNETTCTRQKHEKDLQIDSTSYVLDELESFTKYDVFITACTVECSNDASNLVTFETLIGAPKNTSLPKVEKKTISWSPPTHMGGNLSFYELKIESRIDGAPSEVIYRLKTLGCQLPDFCSKETNEYKILVRAVNVNASNFTWNIQTNLSETRLCSTDEELENLPIDTLIPGEWSESPYNCYSNKLFSMSTLYLIILLLILSGSIGFFSYRGYLWCSEGSKIMCDFPDGLKEVSDVNEINGKKSDSLLKFLFSRQRQGSSITGPDIIFVHASNDSNPYIEYKGPTITRDSLIEEAPQQNHQNEQIEPLLPLNFRSDLVPIYEAPERNYYSDMEIPLTQTPKVNNPVSTPYIQMTSLEHRSPPQQIPTTGDYVPITRGFTQANYFGRVVQPAPRNFIKDMIRISQSAQMDQQTPVETSFQPTRDPLPVSGYVQPGFTGR